MPSKRGDAPQRIPEKLTNQWLITPKPPKSRWSMLRPWEGRWRHLTWTDRDLPALLGTRESKGGPSISMRFLERSTGFTGIPESRAGSPPRDTKCDGIHMHIPYVCVSNDNEYKDIMIVIIILIIFSPSRADIHVLAPSSRHSRLSKRVMLLLLSRSSLHESRIC
mmetsp:Transcript_4451/g.8673  ORF Transcript_4451/g.8673 Transcript_4451/m.8673 type:complete len:165 (+) Transcript_4451:1238-1732(+)